MGSLFQATLTGSRICLGKMRVILIIAIIFAPHAEGQFFNAIRNLFRPVQNVFQGAANLVGGEVGAISEMMGLRSQKLMVVKNCFLVIVDEIQILEQENSAFQMVSFAKIV
eukprot:TRINITY_DN26227_c0_g1_i1.p1 TRINITY_DN26227_c0_g1~~TRINITY_DN26227_c0_g1_i1.p1  ORF type:complete len:111 (-),score=14.61 TRINITY_DN26227_c0_g1_i1:152-484(-)